MRDFFSILRMSSFTRQSEREVLLAKAFLCWMSMLQELIWQANSGYNMGRQNNYMSHKFYKQHLGRFKHSDHLKSRNAPE